jgi:CubicO group peptidase (beta-lactamase class C family)
MSCISTVFPVLLAALAVATYFLDPALLVSTASGFNSKIMCTELFVSGRTHPDDLYYAELTGIFALLRSFTTIDLEEETVTTSVLGLTRAAHYVPGYGCTLVQPNTAHPLSARGPVVSGENAIQLTVLPVAERDTALAAAIEEFAFQPFEYADSNDTLDRHTHGLVVLHQGQIVYEAYGENPAFSFNQDTPHYGWSMAKSVIAALVGLRIQQGALKLTDPLCPGCECTIEDGLRMQSGLEFEEVYHPLLVKDPSAMLFHHLSTVKFATDKPQEFPPATDWKYSSGTSNLLSRALRDSFGDDYAAYAAFPHLSLFNPLGLNSAVFEVDSAGDFVGSSFVSMTPRDWAKFGQFYLNEHQQETLFPKDWVEFTRTASALSEGQYGGHFWTGSPLKYPWKPFPQGGFACLGYRGQQVFILPEKELVIVRVGHTKDPLAWDVGGFAQLVSAFFDVSQ